MENLKELLGKYSEGKISLKEMIELSEQLNDGQSKEAEKIIFEQWEKQLKADETPQKDLKPVLLKIHHRIRLSENKGGSGFMKWWQGFQKMAAILIIPLIVGFFVFFYSQAENSISIGSYAEIQCPMGVRTKFVLPDGTVGFLNSGSSLKFPLVFIKNRTVELTGEAYFDVYHNPGIPFHIKTKNLDLQVEGNALNVIANKNENIEEIVLQSGKVKVFSKEGKSLAVISSNEQLIFDIEKQAISTVQVQAAEYSAWKDGKLVFNNENMQQVVLRLSRWYNADIVWIDQQPKGQYNLQATFVDEPLEEVLKLISDKTSFSYKEEKRSTNSEGVYNKRKIIVQTHPSKMGQLK